MVELSASPGTRLTGFQGGRVACRLTPLLRAQFPHLCYEACGQML